MAFVSIVNGSILGRAKIELYLIMVPILASVVYPIPAAWAFGGGWLS